MANPQVTPRALEVTLIGLLSRLPLPVLYRVADVLYLITRFVWKYRRQVVCDNLRRCFPDKSDAEIDQIVKGFYRNIADVAVETVKAISISPDELKRRVTIVNPELLEGFTKKDQAVILMATHQCNWEWLLLGLCVTLPFPIDAVYKPLHNRKFDQLMRVTRSRFGANPIPVGNVIIEIMKRQRTLKGLAIVADQTPVREEEKFWTTFLTQDTAFSVGAEKIARLTRFPVIFAGMRRIRRGHYEVTLQSLAEPPYAKNAYTITERYVGETQRLVAERPADWLWSYRKWKYKKPLYAD